jgi:hypothetical protein
MLSEGSQEVLELVVVISAVWLQLGTATERRKKSHH